MDTATHNNLSSSELSEFRKYSSQFIRAVKSSDAADGYEFEQKYQIQGANYHWFIDKHGGTEPFAGVTTKSRAVIEALLLEAVQNYGR